MLFSGLDLIFLAVPNHRHSTQMKTKTLKLSATDMPDNGRTRVIYKQFELFGPGSRALAPGSIDRQAKADSIAKTISTPGKADSQLREKTQTGE